MQKDQFHGAAFSGDWSFYYDNEKAAVPAIQRRNRSDCYNKFC